MFVVQAGKVNITKTVRDTEKVLATLGAGEFFGEMAILNQKPRSAGAVMAEDGKLLVIDPKTFEAMIRGNVEIAVRLIKKLSDRLQEADDQIENLLLRDPNSRVVHFLMQQARRGKDTPQGKLVTVNLNELHNRKGLLLEEVQEADEQIENLLLRDPNSRVVHYLMSAASKRGKDTPQGKLVTVNLNELHGRMGLTVEEVQEAINKTAKARIIAVVPEGVVVPDTGKMQKYLEFLEMKERFGD